jgi:hypothetical protein
MADREWLLWLVTGWRWCVMLPSVAVVALGVGFALGKL